MLFLELEALLRGGSCYVLSRRNSSGIYRCTFENRIEDWQYEKVITVF